MQDKNEKTIYELFKLSIWIKILGSLGEMVGGFASAFIPSAFVLHAALYFSQGTTDDADDFIAHELIRVAHSFSTSNHLLIGVYFFMRGLVQLLLAIALLRNKIWAYPLLLLVLFFLVVTQIYAIYFSHSIITVGITIIDIVTIYLVGHEYAIVRKIRK